MSENRRTLEDWLGIAVQLFIGALLGALVGASWVWWVSPIDNAIVNWGLLAAVVVICALLSLRYGEDLWTHLKEWI
jgi:hypothetical protein